MGVTLPNFSALLVFEEIPVGAINCSNQDFSALNEFEPETFRAFLDGVRIDQDKVSINPNNLDFTLDFAPLDSETLTIDYVKAC